MKARAIEFTAQPIIPTNGIFLILIPANRHIYLQIFKIYLHKYKYK